MAIAYVAATLFAVSTIAAELAISSITGGEKVACAKLESKYPEQTFYPGSAGYTYETQSGTLLRAVAEDVLTSQCIGPPLRSMALLACLFLTMRNKSLWRSPR